MRRMSKRQSRRREIERLLALRSSKGLSLRALSDRSGIPFGTLSWWSHRLRTEAEAAASGFVELIETEPEEPGPSRRARERREATGELRIHHPSGVIVEFSGALAETVTEQLVARLAT